MTILRQVRAPWLRREQSRRMSLTIGTTTVGMERQTVRNFGKPRTPYHSSSPFFPPLSGGDPRKLIGMWVQEYKVSNATTRDLQIVNLSDGRSTTPTNNHPSPDENTQTTDPDDHSLEYFFRLPLTSSPNSGRTGGKIPGSQGTYLWVA